MTGIVIQARMGSTRLPGKVLREVRGRTLLEFCARRASLSRHAELVAIATTLRREDDAVIDEAGRLGLPCFRGSEDDVLSRYHGAATRFGLRVVCRVTSDCPFIDPEVIDQVFDLFLRGGYDYASNATRLTYPRGLDVEVFRYEALDRAHREARSAPEREHVTPFLYGHPELFALGNLEAPEDLSRHRWTVDEPDDLRLVDAVLQHLPMAGIDFSYRDVLRVIAEHPEIERINAHVRQKAV